MWSIPIEYSTDNIYLSKIIDSEELLNPELCINNIKLIIQWYWIIIEPFLFGLVGTGINILSLNVILLGKTVGLLFGGFVFRFIGVQLALINTKFDKYERLFVGISWFPKGSVQAALASTILDAATTENNALYIEWGNEIISIAVISILIT